MTELELLRELGDGTPLAELADLADARTRLMREISAERAAVTAPRARPSARIRRPRRSRLVAAATVSLAAAAAVVFGMLQSGASHVRSMASDPVGQLPVLARPTAVQVLHRAAFVALASATITPRGDQFVYTRTTQSPGHTIQSWLSVDGTRASRVGPHSMPGCVNGRMSMRLLREDGGKLRYDGPIFTRRCTPQRAYFPDMPTRAAGMLPYLERTQGVRPDDLNDIAKTVGELLDSDYLLPAQQAALYGFLAQTPGITVRRDVTDVAGRPGVGVAWSSGGGQAMLIFDSRTYTYLGMSTRGVGGQRSGTALLTTAIVAAVGQVSGPSATPAPTDGA